MHNALNVLALNLAACNIFLIMKWNIGRTRFTPMVGDGKEMPLGLKFKRFDAASHGTVDIVRYWPFESTVSGGYHYYTIIDKNRIGYCPYKGMDTFMEKDVVKNGVLVKAGRIFTSMGSVYQHPNVHCLVKFKTTSA